MAERATATVHTATVHMAATPGEIIAVIADVPAYPEWISYVRAADVLATDERGRPASVRFSIDAAMVKDSCVFRYEWRGDGEVSWWLTEGSVLTAMDGSYRVRPADGGAHVDHSLSLDLNLPMAGLFARKAGRSIMEAGLRELKKRVERSTVE